MHDMQGGKVIPNRYVPALALITVAGLALRLVYINQPMRYDEAFSYLFFVQVPLTSTLSDYSVPNQHILNSLLMRLSSAIFGDEPWALRLPALIFGVAIIPATFFAFRHVVDSPAALLASGFAAVSSQLVLYSTNARGYSLIVLLFLGAIWLSASGRLARSESAWKALVGVSVLGFYTIPIMLYAIGGIWLWHGADAFWVWRSSGDRQPLKRVVTHAAATAALTALLYAPVIIGTGFVSLVANDWVTARAPAHFAAELPIMIRDLWRGWHAGLPLPLAFILGIGLVSFVGLGRKRCGSGTLLLAVAAWCAALLCITMRAPFPRVFLFLLPLYFALAVFGLIELARRAGVTLRMAQIGGYALCGWAGIGVVSSPAVRRIEGPLFPDAPAVVSYLAHTVREGDGVYARTPADAPIWYYTWLHGLPDGMLRLKYNARSRVLVVVNASDGQTIEQVLAETRMPARFTPPVLRRSFEHARVYEMLRVPHAAPPTTSTVVRPSNPARQSRAAASASAARGTG